MLQQPPREKKVFVCTLLASGNFGPASESGSVDDNQVGQNLLRETKIQETWKTHTLMRIDNPELFQDGTGSTYEFEYEFFISRGEL